MQDFLGIYMNDQLALGTLWRELARRSQRSNSGTELGDALARVSSGIAEDVETFQQMMRRLGIPMNPIKMGLAVGAERMGRLKLNGGGRTYSPLSRFEELDILAMGIEGKKLLWVTLRDLAGLRFPPARHRFRSFDRAGRAATCRPRALPCQCG